MSNFKRKTLLYLVLMNVITSSVCTSALAADAADVPPATRDLQGGVAKTETDTDANAGQLNSNANVVDLNAATAAASLNADANAASANSSATSTPLKGSVTRKHSPGFSLFGQRWTTDAYRNLNYGILGVVMTRWLFAKDEKVTKVFRDCPAALAGIKPGDVVIAYGNHTLDGHETQKTTWGTADGIAGTHVDYTVRRHGKLITFDLVRMNIEDIQNGSVRRMYEQMLRDLGPPGEVQRKLEQKFDQQASSIQQPSN